MPPAHARLLAEWSYGLVLARGVQLVAVTLRLAALIRQVREAVGDDERVFVLTDRGLESVGLFRDLVTADCHPLLRVKAGGFFRPAGRTEKEPLACTLLACRVAGYEDPVADPDGPAASCPTRGRAWNASPGSPKPNSTPARRPTPDSPRPLSLERSPLRGNWGEGRKTLSRLPATAGIQGEGGCAATG